MINLNEIEQEISTLEQRETSYSNCERLAMLYVVRDHLKSKHDTTEDGSKAKAREEPSAKSDGAHIIKAPESSEFLKAVNGKNAESAWKIMDELMTDTLKIINPRLYDGVINKINQL